MSTQQPPQEYPEDDYADAPPLPFSPEGEINNIVGQIDPAQIVDNFNHALKGEYFNKEKGSWESIGKELVNAECRGWVISYSTSLMNNASTMGIISKDQLNYLMWGIIRTVAREFRCNLERFGFVPPGKYYKQGEYENKGSPDTARMDMISEMIFQRALLIYSRSLSGTESTKIFKSLSMVDQLYGGQKEQEPKGIFGGMFHKKR